VSAALHGARGNSNKEKNAWHLSKREGSCVGSVALTNYKQLTKKRLLGAMTKTRKLCQQHCINRKEAQWQKRKLLVVMGKEKRAGSVALCQQKNPTAKKRRLLCTMAKEKETVSVVLGQ